VADPVLHVVVYNGDRRWDAPVTFAGLVARAEEDGAAHLALSYEVLDLVAVRGDDLPRTNLLRWVAEVEQSVQAGALPERLSAVLAEVTDADRLAEAGEWIVDCATPAEFLARVDRSGS
jgi:hypothetical protein